MDLDRALGELDARNQDNVTRTESYLELYAFSRARGLDLPWLLMAHLVSRNAGYLMTDLARALGGAAGGDPAMAGALTDLFLLLERGNWLIFWDAWHHVTLHLAGRSSEMAAGRVPAFMRDAWRRYEAAAAHGVDATVERAIVLDLVHNEQHFIERRAVHLPRLAAGLRAITFIEQSGREKPMHFPVGEAEIKVGGFGALARRIETGRRIFDEVVAERARRDALFAWARANAHTGSRAVYGGKPGPTLGEAWPVARVKELWAGVHAPPEADPSYP
jgi:hypothetical protein